jgi:hypothetical protein
LNVCVSYYLKGAFLLHTRDTAQQYWLGIHREEGQWQWLDGSSYNHWHEFDSSNNPDEKCARFVYRMNAWTWKDDVCFPGKQHRYICMEGKVVRKELLGRKFFP